MQDQYGRDIHYLRISITDRCNLRCRYCMPEGIQPVPMVEILTYEEILTIVKCAAELGIRHIKVTGGEPLVRKGCTGFIGCLKEIPGIESVTLTTNGIVLEDYLDELEAVGVDGINVSMDTRQEDLFRMITGGGDVKRVLRAIEKSLNRGLKIKINAVSIDWEKMAQENNLRDIVSNSGWMDMALLAQELPVDVRFIEMMPIGLGKSICSISHEKLLQEMQETFPEIRQSSGFHGFGPARYYHIPGFLGDVGLISALHGKFCESCNRVRLTAKGYLKTCLCYEDGVDLKKILRADSNTEGRQSLERAVRDAIWQKAKAHCFEAPSDMTETKPMSLIGG